MNNDKSLQSGVSVTDNLYKWHKYYIYLFPFFLFQIPFLILYSRAHPTQRAPPPHFSTWLIVSSYGGLRGSRVLSRFEFWNWVRRLMPWPGTAPCVQTNRCPPHGTHRADHCASPRDLIWSVEILIRSDGLNLLIS